jgi:HEAT repeat protein
MNETSIQYDALSTWELINVLLSSNDEDDIDSAYWSAISALHQRGTVDVFEAARSLCESACPRQQSIGCNILSQLGRPEMPFASMSFPLVSAIMLKTDSRDTLTCALCALGWLHDLRGVPHVLRHVDHPDSDIRYWATHALVALHEDWRSINALIRLTNDLSVEVRDWATFGLGSMTEKDAPAIRQALVARLNDPDNIVRGEALIGLAKRPACH